MKGSMAMKIIKRGFCIIFAAVLLLSNVVTASAFTSVNEFDYLQAAIETINAVPTSEADRFVETNREWIDEVGTRLDAYLETMTEEQKNDAITLLFGGNPLARSGNLDEYFSYVEYHYRGGYWTYSMDPKVAVRLWKSTMEAAWAELEDHYYGIRNDNGSLWNQYRCHWDYDAFGIVAGTWDLEVGRPVIDYSEMFGALCNP